MTAAPMMKSSSLATGILADCLRRAAGGDEEAFAAFYDQTRTLAYGLALRILRNPEDAGEVVVDAYLQVWRNAARFESGRGTPLAWLTMIVRSRALDRLRGRGGRARELGDDTVLNLLPDTRSNAEESLDSAETIERVRRAFAKLPAVNRRVLEMAYFEGKSHTEIAEALGDPLGTVKSRARSGIRALRQGMLGSSTAAPPGSMVGAAQPC